MSRRPIPGARPVTAAEPACRGLSAALRELFGYDAFKPYQEPIIEQVMAGSDVLAVLPTGGGKSLCYQLPAALLPGPTLVVSPLISLMKDQFDNLPPALRDKATIINSSVPQDEIQERLADIERGRTRLIYAAPERLRQQGFLERMERVGLSLVVVDEAHCVSVWGHDFRPDYLFIRRALERLAEAGSRPPLLAVTATATPEMQREIQAQFGRTMNVTMAPLFRPNLRLEALRCADNKEKTKALVRICRSTPGPGIVYATSRAKCEELADNLRGAGIVAEHYHAGLNPDSRRLTQERFMEGRTRVVAATIAFGMGIDKPDVRLVAHYMLPTSVENYMQEVGRAGRDGKPSRCVLLHTASDQGMLSRWMRSEAVDLDDVKVTYRALRAMLTAGSRTIDAEDLTEAAFGAGRVEEKGTAARVAISIMESCNMLVRHADYGRSLVVELLPAPPAAKITIENLIRRRRQHAELRLDGVVSYASSSRCRHATLARHFGQTMEPCGTSCDRCDGGEEPEPPGKAERSRGRSASRAAAQGKELDPSWSEASPYETERFEALRDWRKGVAAEAEVPAFVIFADRTLRAIAAANPKRLADLAGITGVGPAKLQRHGDGVLEALRRAEQDPGGGD